MSNYECLLYRVSKFKECQIMSVKIERMSNYECQSSSNVKSQVSKLNECQITSVKFLLMTND